MVLLKANEAPIPKPVRMMLDTVCDDYVMQHHPS